MTSCYWRAVAWATLTLSVHGCGNVIEREKSPSRSSCPSSSEGECDTHKDGVQEAREKRALALADENWEESARQTLDLNYHVEILDAYQKDADTSALWAIDQKYKALQKLLERLNSSDLQYAKHECSVEARHTCQKLKREITDILAKIAGRQSAGGGADVSGLRLEALYRNDLYLTEAIKATPPNESHYSALWEVFQNISRFDRRNSPVLMECAFESASLCADAEESLVVLRKRRDAALAEGKTQEARDLSLKINLKSEYLDLMRQGHTPDSAEIASLEQKYASLTALATADGVRPYTEREQEAVRRVFKEYGQLYIAPSPLDADGKPVGEEVKADGGMPWSGYWYPKRKDDLFRDDNAPLVKFDKMAKELGMELKSAEVERAQFNPEEAEWAGLCDAWALAAVQTPEPTTPLTFGGVTFSVSDQKALLIKKYEGSSPIIFGNRYFGNFETDGEIQDLRPEAFHRLVEAVIGGEKRAFAVDDDPGPEIWSKPFFRMRWLVEQDPSRDDSFIVKAWPYLVKSRNWPSDDLTQPQDMKAPVYEYKLYVDKSQVQDGKYLVIHGEWIGTSLKEHPDMVFLPSLDPASINPGNPEIAKGQELIDRLFSEGQAG